MATSAGKVAFVAKGAYNAATTYHILDFVIYKGSSYVAKTTTVGNLPTDTQYWQILADGAGGTHYGVCETAAGTATKAVSTTDQGFDLETGASVTVKFANKDTAGNITLNVDSTGAKAVYFNGEAIKAGVLDNKNPYIFIYNGTRYDLISSAGMSEEIQYADWRQLTPQQRADGTTRYIPDYPGLGGVYVFNTEAAMQAAITNGDVPLNAVCITDEDTPYVVDAGDVTFDNTGTDIDATDVEGAIKELDDEVGELNSNLSDLYNDDYHVITGLSSKYTLVNSDDGRRSRYLIRGGICYAVLTLICVTPSSSSEKICVLPKIASVMGNNMSVNARSYYDPNDNVSILNQNGNVYCIGGVANVEYAINFSYPVDN